MKKSFRRLGASAALTAAIIAGVPGSVEHAPNIYPDAITVEQEAGYNALFADAQEYWTRRGVKGLEDTRVEYISGNEIGHCALFETVRSGDTTMYCTTNNTIFMTAETAASISPDSYLGQMVAFHEYGHRVQDAEGATFALPPKTELGATCLAGTAMINIRPMTVLMSGMNDALFGTEYTRVVGASDLLHGTIEQEHAALAQGITRQDCTSFGTRF